nr:hypothetical protein [Nanoarchaeum sp.]
KTIASNEEFTSLLANLNAPFKEQHSDEFGQRRVVAVSNQDLAEKILEARKNKECFQTEDELQNVKHYHCPVCGYVKDKVNGLYTNHPRQSIKYSCRICDSYMGTELIGTFSQ